MKETIRYGFILAMICVLASGLLAGVNSLTKPRIIAQAQEGEEAALREVMPQGEYFEPVKSGGDIIYYKARNKENKFIGVAFKASGKGYSGVVETLVGMAKDGRVANIKILNQAETPGLGNRITEPAFMERFRHKDIPGLSEVQAITGATISSKAVIDSVREKAGQIEELIKNER